MAAAASVVAQQQTAPVPWSGCCGVSPWPTMGPGMMGRGMMGQGGQGMMGQGGQGMMGQGGQGMMGGGYGSMPRMHFAMMSGIPAPYNSTEQPAAENPRDGRTRRCGIREKLRFLPRNDRLRRRASGPNALAARPPISRFFRKCRWFSGTRSCTGRSPRAARSLAVRCPHSKIRCPKTRFGQSSPIYRPDCHRQQLSKNKNKRD